MGVTQFQQNLKKSHPKHATLAPLSPIKDVSSLPVLSHEEIKANLDYPKGSNGNAKAFSLIRAHCYNIGR